MHRYHCGPHQLHAKYVRLLAFAILGTHVDPALEAEQGAGQGGGDPVLTGAGLGDDLALAHALGEQGLTQHLVGLVGAAVQQVFTLEVKPGLGSLGQIAGEGQGRRAPGILGQEFPKLGNEGRVILGIDEGLLQLEQGGDQDLGHIHATKFTKKRIEQGHGYLPLHSAIEIRYEPWRAEAYGWGTYMSSTKFTEKRVEQSHRLFLVLIGKCSSLIWCMFRGRAGHSYSWRRAPKAAAILCASFWPGALSTPELKSRPRQPTWAACRALSGLSPPASISLALSSLASMAQSNA
ncbi:hypothetical protein D3C84_738290 [compost metagenome]